MVRVGNNTSARLILNTWPLVCVLSTLLYSLFTHNCVASHGSNTIIKFADNTTLVGLINDNDETAYKEEVRDLSVWCQDKNLSLNVSKTKELIVDYRKRRSVQASILIDGVVSEEGPKNCQGLHPSHRLFSLLPHGKRYRRTKSRSKRHLNSFYPQAIRLLNKSTGHPDYLH